MAGPGRKGSADSPTGCQKTSLTDGEFVYEDFREKTALGIPHSTLRSYVKTMKSLLPLCGLEVHAGTPPSSGVWDGFLAAVIIGRYGEVL